jgi:hypothetical protein
MISLGGELTERKKPVKAHVVRAVFPVPGVASAANDKV